MLSVSPRWNNEKRSRETRVAVSTPRVKAFRGVRLTVERKFARGGEKPRRAKCVRRLLKFHWTTGHYARRIVIHGKEKRWTKSWAIFQRCAVSTAAGMQATCFLHPPRRTSAYVVTYARPALLIARDLHSPSSSSFCLLARRTHTHTHTHIYNLYIFIFILYTYILESR